MNERGVRRARLKLEEQDQPVWQVPGVKNGWRKKGEVGEGSKKEAKKRKGGREDEPSPLGQPRRVRKEKFSSTDSRKVPS